MLCAQLAPGFIMHYFTNGQLTSLTPFLFKLQFNSKMLVSPLICSFNNEWLFMVIEAKMVFVKNVTFLCMATWNNTAFS